MIRSTFLALGLSALALPAMAEGWSITHLETMTSSGACMEQGRSVINRYMFAHGGGSTGAEPYGYVVYRRDLASAGGNSSTSRVLALDDTTARRRPASATACR